MGKKEEQCRYYREQLIKDRERLADLEERGDAACSAYDLSFGYNAEFNKQLKRNHIAYDLKQLEGCPEPVRQTTLFSAEPVQASMFDSHLEAAYEDAQSGMGDWE
jgi:hypothetical protein